MSETEGQVFRLVNDATDRVRVPVWAIMQSGSLAAVFVVAGDQYRRGTKSTAMASLIAGFLVWGGVKAIKPRIGRGRTGTTPREGFGPRKPTNRAWLPFRPRRRGHNSGPHSHPGTSSWPTRAAAIAVAGLTGGARMYAGAHLPLDVASGTAIGVLCGRAANALLDSPVARLQP